MVKGARADALRLAAVKSGFGTVNRILSVPSSIAVAYYLGPFQLGILALLRLTQQYIGYAHLGLLFVLPRDVPMAYGRGDPAEARLITEIVYSGYAAATAFGLLVFWGLFLGGMTWSGALDLPRMVLVTAILTSNAALTFIRDYAKAESRFMAIAKADGVVMIGLPLLTVPAVIVGQLNGALAAMFAVNLATLGFYSHLLRGVSLRLRVELHRTVQLIRTGMLIFLNKISDSVFAGIDLMVIAWLLTPSEVGLYSVALTTLATVHLFLAAINDLTYQRMMRETGAQAGTDPSIYRRYTGVLLALYLLVNSTVLGWAILSAAFLIRVTLHMYAPALPVMIVLSVGYTVYGSMVFMRYYLDATRQLPRRIVVIAGAFVVSAVLDYVTLKLGYGLVGVAVASAATSLLAGGAILHVCFQQIHGSWRDGARLLARLVLIGGGLAILLWAGVQWEAVPFTGRPPVERWLLGGLDLAIKASLYGVVTVSLYLLAFRRSGLRAELINLATIAMAAIWARVARLRFS